MTLHLDSKNIDIVYLWVDGKDLNWRLKKQRAELDFMSNYKLASYGNVEGRFRDNQEIPVYQTYTNRDMILDSYT